VTKAEIEWYRQNLDDRLYMDSAVKSIATCLMNGQVKLEIPHEVYCPRCKSMKPKEDFYLSSNVAYCKPCFREYLRKRKLKV
jgi:late competence protein required for DNA uptake (superfamily II DNA/RNA helicase)